MDEREKFEVVVCVGPEDEEKPPYLQRLTIYVDALIHKHSGNLTEYILNEEALELEWWYADEDDEDDYEYLSA